jgi:hypothetical protein
MNNPTIQVQTNWGVLTLAFVDPDGYAEKRWESDRPVAYVSGTLIIRQIVVEVQVYLSWVTIDGVRELRKMNADSRTFRKDGREWDLKAQYHATVNALWDTVIRVAYEANPKLQTVAKYARLSREYDRLRSIEEDAKAKWTKATQDRETAGIKVFQFSEQNSDVRDLLARLFDG